MLWYIDVQVNQVLINPYLIGVYITQSNREQHLQTRLPHLCMMLDLVRLVLTQDWIEYKLLNNNVKYYGSSRLSVELYITGLSKHYSVKQLNSSNQTYQSNV